MVVGGRQLTAWEVDESLAPPELGAVQSTHEGGEGLPGEGGVLGHGARDGGVQGVDALAVHDTRGICRLGHCTFFCLKKGPQVLPSIIL